MGMRVRGIKILEDGRSILLVETVPDDLASAIADQGIVGPISKASEMFMPSVPDSMRA